MLYRALPYVVRALVCATCVSLLPACGDDAPSLVVQVVSGISPVGQFASVKCELFQSAAEETSTELLRQSANLEALASQDFAHGFQVAHFAGVTEGRYVVQVQLLKSDGLPLIRRRVIVDVQANSVVRVAMTPNCISAMCPAPGGNAGFTECIDGHCVDARCNPPSAEFCEGLTFCSQASSCGPTADCAEATCIDGVCNSAPRADVCEPPLFCNSLSTTPPGCEPYPAGDAGVEPDASSLDAGQVDASELDASADASLDAASACGTLCIDPGNPCLFGTVECSSGSPVCDATLERIGLPCGGTGVCGIGGACVDCVQDGECQIGCDVGHLECGAGTPVCVANASAEHVAAGTVCDAACAGGTVCPGFHVCSTSASCVTCDDGAPCITGCQYGHISCATGGECVSDGINLPTFTSCGDAGQVCNEYGTCADCVNGASCNTPSDCGHGTLSACGTSFVSCTLDDYEEPGAACRDPSEGTCSGDGRCYPAYEGYTVETAGSFTCTIRADRRVECWGYDTVGEWTDSAHKQIIAGVEDVAEIGNGYAFICARTQGGDVYCRGSNRVGELGDGTFTSSSVALLVDLPRPAIDLAVHNTGACAALDDGTVQCWGTLQVDAPRTMFPVPTAVPGITNAVQITTSAFGDRAFVCARLDTGQIACWGHPRYGVFGDGVPWSMDPGVYEYVGTPRMVAGISDATDISAAFSSVCALRASGQVWCWGTSLAGYGDFPSSTVAYSGTPFAGTLLPFTDIVKLSSAYSARCVLRANGEVWCFHSTGYAGLGRGFDFVTPAYQPAPVVGIHDAVDVSEHSTCLRRASGSLLCWGQDFYNDPLGIGLTDVYAYAPTALVGGTP